MIVVDTNIWARALLGDDPGQSSRARQALAAARGKDGVFVPIVVLAELSWVLRSVRWDRERIRPAGIRPSTFLKIAGRNHLRGMRLENVAAELAKAELPLVREGALGRRWQTDATCPPARCRASWMPRL